MGRYVFKLPDVGEGTAEAEIVAWHVKPGDRIEEDQNLVDVMTDKATVEMTSPIAGEVIALHGGPGDMAAVGAPLVEIEIAGDGNAVSSAQDIAPPAQKLEPHKPVPQPQTVTAAAPPAPADRPLASPAVRQRARDRGIDLRSVRGSGPAGRVVQDDLDAAVAPGTMSSTAPRGPRADVVEDIKIIGLRRKIAEKMQEAKRRIPHFTFIDEVDMTEVEDLRAHLNQTRRAATPKLTVLPFLVRAIALAIVDFPQMNARFDDAVGVIHRHAALHMGIATQTANGLMVPVVRHAESLDIWQCAVEIARVAAAARDNKAKSEELSGSTITITSLGTLGGVAATPVINHPEVAIIGPNAIVERPVVRDGRIAVRRMMNLSSSFDHRVVDGYDAAAFIRRIRTLLEHPATLFMG
ncbi:MAG: dihydrolipoamide acetyltransferase family protein [Rhizomicrobium sp.]